MISFVMLVPADWQVRANWLAAALGYDDARPPRTFISPLSV